MPMASRTEEKQRARAAREAAEAADERKARRRASILRLGLVLGLAVVVVVVAIVVSSGNSGGGGGSAANSGGGSGGDTAAVAAEFKGIPQNGVTLGDAKAKYTLLEFADLQCPYCAEYSNQALPTVVDRYVRTGRLKYELRLVGILGQDSVNASGAAAAAAKQDKLYQFADLFWRRQGPENSGYVTDKFISDVAKGSGVAPAAAVAGFKNPQSQPLVREATTQASSLGSSGTPDFYLRLPSGRLVHVQPQDLTASAFTQALDQALAQT
jgi:protein-disulfide isomerase